MFLFLSKLLPLFLYPLGFSCLLLLIALGLIWKKPRWAAGFLGVALVILLVSSSEWTARQLTKSLEFQNIPQGELPAADAIVILGGATNPPDPPRPGVDLREEGDRVIYGGQLFRAGKAPKIILSGGRVDWWGKSSPESADMATILEFIGLPATALIQEPNSLNTRQNAVNVKQILDAQGMKKILLVTSAMHMPRSLRIFRKLGIDAIAAPTDYRITTSQDALPPTAAAAVLSALPSAENLHYTSKALKEYVGLVVYWLRGWI